ncbi:DNA gyrase inhibitor YacG [Geoalkalibacter sp.]|uniref:DNA gyrase inhibitor YacG n=1 Tax=Geoalkalibacter sp. TaxID=3041440 RepID=UPI00272EC01A|nr:DNA gyrase inhibitor YacG [Geoalkalibacter sp.]
MGEKIVRLLRCPRCRKQVVWEGNPHRPFCSEKCRLVDLGKWAQEEYTIPGEKVSDEESQEDN